MDEERPRLTYWQAMAVLLQMSHSPLKINVCLVPFLAEVLRERKVKRLKAVGVAPKMLWDVMYGDLSANEESPYVFVIRNRNGEQVGAVNVY